MESQKKCSMKKVLLPIMALAILIAFYEVNKPQKNSYVICISIAIFMFGMLKLSAKIPSKNQEQDDDNIQ